VSQRPAGPENNFLHHERAGFGSREMESANRTAMAGGGSICAAS